MRSILLLVMVFASAAPADDESVFHLGRYRAREAVVTIGPERPEGELDGPAMALRLRGVLAVWRGSELGDLLGSLPREARTVGSPRDATRVCVVHLDYGRVGDKRVEIVRTAGGTFVARELDEGSDGEIDVAEMDRIRAAELLMGLDQFRGSYSAAPDVPVGEVFLVEGEKTPGWLTVDEQLLSERLWGGRPTQVHGSMRFLDEERLHVRLPRGYDPRRPAGVLVWVSPSDDGRIPGSMHSALDELYMIGVGADESGNRRPIADRYQLAFDGLATVRRRFHVDPRRVYVTGFSGGGRVASMLHGAFADVFSGSVPIGGVNAYKPVAMGDGRYWRPGYRRPSGEVFGEFRDQRMACVTGPEDFNYENVRGVVRVLRADGIEARVWEVQELGHEMPPAGEFSAALSWVDERYRREREHEREEAAELMATYRRRFADSAVERGGQRRMLEMAMERGPWTEAAWEAAGVLGLAGR